MMSLEINGQSIELSRKRIKNLILKISPDGQIKVSAPLRCSLETIHSFLHNKQAWIDSNLARIKTRPIQTPPQLISGETVFYLGKAYELKISNLHPTTILDNTYLHLHLHNEAILETKHALLKNWYKQEMRALLPALIQKWEPIIDVTVNEWGIRAMKTRWGSCNIIKKRIWLNLALIQYPMGCLESVLVHEMVHLLEASHNHRFYALMDQFMPEWPAYKKLLRNPA